MSQQHFGFARESECFDDCNDNSSCSSQDSSPYRPSNNRLPLAPLETYKPISRSKRKHGIPTISSRSIFQGRDHTKTRQVARYTSGFEEHSVTSKENICPNVYQRHSTKGNQILSDEPIREKTQINSQEEGAKKRKAVRLTNRSLLEYSGNKSVTTRPTIPTFKQNFIEKITRLKAQEVSTKQGSLRINSCTNTPDKKVRKRFLAINLEVEMKHDLAQQAIAILNENERILQIADSKLTSFLDRSVPHKNLSCLPLLAHLEKDWRQRISNIAKVFDLIKSKREPSLPEDLLETILKTPKSLAKTIQF